MLWRSASPSSRHGIASNGTCHRSESGSVGDTCRRGRPPASSANVWIVTLAPLRDVAAAGGGSGLAAGGWQHLGRRSDGSSSFARAARRPGRMLSSRDTLAFDARQEAESRSRRTAARIVATPPPSPRERCPPSWKEELRRTRSSRRRGSRASPPKGLAGSPANVAASGKPQLKSAPSSIRGLGSRRRGTCEAPRAARSPYRRAVSGGARCSRCPPSAGPRG